MGEPTHIHDLISSTLDLLRGRVADELREVTVEEVLEDGVVPLWHPDDDERVQLGTWGTTLARNARWSCFERPPYQFDPQPTYTHHCEMCHRPITPVHGSWRDHAGRFICDDGPLVDGEPFVSHLPLDPGKEQQ